MNIRILFGVFVLLLIGVSCVYGFEDTVQRYPISDIWIEYIDANGAISKVNDPPLYPTSQSIKFLMGTTVGTTKIAYIETINLIDVSRFSFTVRDKDSHGWTYENTYIKAYVKIVNSNDVVIGTIEVPIVTYHDNDFYEFVLSSGNVLSLYINGVYNSQTTLSTSETNAYLRIQLTKWVRGGYSNTDTNYYIIDDISTSSIIGMNEEWTEAPTYIDTSYGVQSMFSFPTAIYTLETKHVAIGTVINTTTLPSNQGASDKPAGFVRWNRNDIFGSNWGLYHVQLFRDSTKLAETTFTYFDSTISGSVLFDQDSYSQGQTANIDYSITSSDFATYTYYLKVMDVYGTVQDSYTLTAASGTKSPVLADYDSGIYYAILSRTNKASGVNEEFAYDYASVTETVYIVGNVTEAVSGTNMQNVSIQCLQGSTYYNTTSAADGTYNVSDLSVSVSTTITANATYANDTNFGNNSYNLSTFSFTPLAAEIYNVDLILFDVNHTYDNASAYGLIYDNIYHQPIESATVNIYNSTWSNSTTSTATGYYVFHNLTANGTYSINATATGYIDTIDYEINTTTLNATRQDVPMSTLYTVTVKARDATTLAYLSDFTATLDGAEGTAINGTVTFNNVEYGLHAISAIADDFYPSATTPLIDEDTEITLDLTRLASEYYSPHRVKFTVKTLWGTLYSGVAVNVYTGATASGDTLYTGTTGTDGAVAFELAEYIQYTLTFIDASQSIDESITLYPIENSYPVYIYDTLAPDDEDIESEEVTVTVTTSEINDTHAYINVTYTDAMNETTDLNIYINQSDESDPFNQTVITFANLGATSSVTHSFIIDDYPGQAYFINIEATQTTFGDIQRTYSVRFDGMLEDYGYSKIWVWIGVGGMMFVAGMFKASKAEQGALIVCVAGWVFMGMGFFDSLGSQAVTSMAAGLGLATVLAIGANMSKKDRDETT